MSFLSKNHSHPNNLALILFLAQKFITSSCQSKYNSAVFLKPHKPGAQSPTKHHH